MPARSNKHAGIKKMSDGAYFARVFAKRIEVSKKLPTQADAIAWRDQMRTDLRRAPDFVAFYRDQWEASHECPTGTMTFRDPDLDAVVAWYRDTDASLKSGSWVDPRVAEVTLGAYVSRWRSEKVGIAGKTWAGYESLLRRHISTLYGKKLRAISTGDVRAWVAALGHADVGPVSIRQAYRLLHSILESALADELIARNPAAGVQLPAKPRKKMRALTVDELRALAAACGQDHELMILFAGHCGLRFGEITALRVADFNSLRREVTVDKAWTTDATGRRIEGPTKSKLSRTVPVPPALMTRIQERLGARKPEDFAFTAAKGGPISDGYFRKTVFDKARAAAGLPEVRFHDLRHTCASLLIQIGTPITAVSEVLGHASTKMTLDTYGHFYPGDGAKWMDALESHVETEAKPSPSAA